MLTWIIGMMIAGSATAAPRDVARRLHDRLAGTPPSQATLDQLTALIEAGQFREAAMQVMNTETFLSITVKNMASQWTNVDEVVDVPLNDYSATVIGMIRDDVSFDQLLFGDVVYVGNTALALPAYSLANNTHYTTFESQRRTFRTDLVRSQQSTVRQLPIAAGAYTLRGFGEAYYNMGTNRRPVRFTAMTFLCRDLEQLSDVTRPDPYVRRDVDRAPGGDPRAFRNQCVGCHSGMDPLSKAFVNFDFVNNTLTYNAAVIPEKINRNADTFPAGYITGDDQWHLLWTEGSNANIGWNGATTGKGVVEFGRMIAQTEAFSTCMAERVFHKVCLRGPASDAEVDGINDIAGDFKSGGMKMKELFAGSAAICLQ